MRYSFIVIPVLLFITFLISCESSVNSDKTDDTTAFFATDSIQNKEENNLNCSHKTTDLDSLTMLPVLAGNSVTLFKLADTTSEVIHEISFHSTCLILTSDVLELKPIVRCIHDSCIGYVRRKDLFQTFDSNAESDKKYLVWHTADDSVKICRLNTKNRSIEDQLCLKNTGMYIHPSLLYSQSWTETAFAVKIEMNPAACEETHFQHVVDFRNKLKFLITTSSFAEGGESWDSYVVLKKDLMLQVVNTNKWQNIEDENDPVHEKTEISEYQWNGDSLEFLSTNLISGN